MILVENKKLHLNYVVTEKIESGIELLGFEVKSIRQKRGSLEGAKVIIRGGEAYLVGSYIAEYQKENTRKDYDPYRNRRLLLKKDEIKKLYGYEQSKNLTLIPNSWYTRSGIIKCEIAICRKKDSRDKREDIKKDISRREMREKL